MGGGALAHVRVQQRCAHADGDRTRYRDDPAHLYPDPHAYPNPHGDADPHSYPAARDGDADSIKDAVTLMTI